MEEPERLHRQVDCIVAVFDCDEKLGDLSRGLKVA